MMVMMSVAGPEVPSRAGDCRTQSIAGLDGREDNVATLVGGVGPSKVRFSTREDG